MRPTWIAALTFLAVVARAQQAPPARTIADAAFLAGSWRGQDEHGRTEEHWLAPDGGLMLGVNRQVSGDGPAHFEYLRIEQRPDGVFYLASPGGKPPTPFKLVEASPGRVAFANSEHDFPKRIVYRLEGDSLVARIEDENGRGMEWTWKRGTLVP